MEANIIKQENNWFNNLVAKYEAQYFGATALMMTLQSCIGGIAAMYIMQTNNYILLAITVAVTMASNTAFIAQIPAKTALKFFAISVVINFILSIIAVFI